MDKRGLIKFISASDLPDALKVYLDRVVAGNLPSSLGKAIKKDPGGFVTGVCGLLREAGLALGCAGDEALFTSGFEVNNMAPDRLEAALAEMLAAVFLRSEGFSGLGFIGRGVGRTADLSGRRGGLDYAFEVCSARTPAAGLSVDFLELKYDKKIIQAKVSGKKGGLDRACLVLVAGPPAFTNFGPDERLAGLARDLYERKRRPPATHLCLLAGGGAAVFPSWEA